MTEKKSCILRQGGLKEDAERVRGEKKRNWRKRLGYIMEERRVIVMRSGPE